MGHAAVNAIRIRVAGRLPGSIIICQRASPPVPVAKGGRAGQIRGCPVRWCPFRAPRGPAIGLVIARDLGFRIPMVGISRWILRVHSDPIRERRNDTWAIAPKAHGRFAESGFERGTGIKNDPCFGVTRFILLR